VATVIAYIDGYNLYHGLKDKFGGRYLWLDPVKLVSRIRPRDTLLEVGYFTAKIRNDAHAESRQQSHLGAMSATGGSCLKITFGRYQEKSLTCRRCGSQWTTYEEKETDVNVAVSLVADAASARADIGLVISADSDLCPAIRTARKITQENGTSFGVVAAFPPKRYSHDLKRLVPRAFTISSTDIRNSLLPECVTDQTTGRKYYRPPEWR
jgi:hypothetical protein